MSDQLRDAFVVLRALREKPRTVAELADDTGIPWRKVYRLLDQMIDFGVPLRRGAGEKPKRGMPPATYSLSVAALREWLG